MTRTDEQRHANYAALNRKPHVIYALCDPGTKNVRYVGCTSNLDDRVQGHQKNTAPVNRAMKVWMAELKDSKQSPTVMVLEELPSLLHGENAERKWIGVCSIAFGKRLLNRSNRGDFFPIENLLQSARQVRQHIHHQEFSQLYQ